MYETKTSVEAYHGNNVISLIFGGGIVIVGGVGSIVIGGVVVIVVRKVGLIFLK